MAKKGIAVVSGSDSNLKTRFSFLETGDSILGGENTSSLHQVTGALEVTGALKLDISGTADGYMLVSDADGNASWRFSASSSQLPGGDDYQVQYNLNNDFTASADLEFSASSNYSTLRVTGSAELFGPPNYSWTQKHPTARPTAVIEIANAYDPDREVIVAFGGATAAGVAQSQTWEWDGQQWNQKFPATSPSARRGLLQSMVYDPDRKVFVLFGGNLNNTTFYNETWEYDGTTWTQIVTATTPSSRTLASLVYDKVQKKVIMFGGATFGPTTPNNETWEYDGTDWTLLSPATSPTARYGAGMAYDESRNITVLAGGTTTSGATQETWEYNGTTWTQILPNTLPVLAIGDIAFTYDPLQKTVILYGANSSVQLLKYDGAVWTDITAEVGTPTPAGASSQIIRNITEYDVGRQELFVYGGLGFESPTQTTLTGSWVLKQADVLTAAERKSYFLEDKDSKGQFTYALGVVNISGSSNALRVDTNLSKKALYVSGDSVDISGSTRMGTLPGHSHQVTGALEVTGTLKLDISGSLVNGYVLTTDTVGNASWQPNTTSSFAAEAGKVSNALGEGTGIVPFTYDGSSVETVAIDESIVVTLTGSQTLTNKIISGTFSGSHTGSFLGDGSGLTNITASEIEAAGDNYEIQFNLNDDLSASPNYTFVSASNLQLTGTFFISGTGAALSTERIIELKTSTGVTSLYVDEQGQVVARGGQVGIGSVAFQVRNPRRLHSLLLGPEAPP